MSQMDYEIIASVISGLPLKRVKKEQVIFAFCKRFAREFADFDDARFMDVALGVEQAQRSK